MNYKCDKCKKTYSSQQSLCNHNKKFHSNNIEKPVINNNKKTCVNCNKQFVNKYTLVNHLFYDYNSYLYHYFYLI